MKQKFLGTFLAISALYLVLLMVPAKGKRVFPFIQVVTHSILHTEMDMP